MSAFQFGPRVPYCDARMLPYEPISIEQLPIPPPYDYNPYQLPTPFPPPMVVEPPPVELEAPPVEIRHSKATEEWLDGYIKDVSDSKHLDDPRAHKYGTHSPSPRNLHERPTRTSLGKEKIAKKAKAAKMKEATRAGTKTRLRLPPEDAPLLPPRNQYAPVNSSKHTSAAAPTRQGSPRRSYPGPQQAFTLAAGKPKQTAKSVSSVAPDHPHYNGEMAASGSPSRIYVPPPPPPPPPGFEFMHGAPHGPPHGYGYGAPYRYGYH